jgi:hypothetical protein
MENRQASDFRQRYAALPPGLAAALFHVVRFTVTFPFHAGAPVAAGLRKTVHVSPFTSSPLPGPDRTASATAPDLLAEVRKPPAPLSATRCFMPLCTRGSFADFSARHRHASPDGQFDRFTRAENPPARFA